MAINIHWRNQMSDEIKKPELVNTGEEKQLDEQAFDKVVGGAKATSKLYEAACKGTHIPEVTIE
jgi:type VI protein secretion system component Hcp